ncbi:MAG: tetratricopeptide repeat protein [Gemmatimonadota bacterium]|nr:MAG: tetratricopeptide repeat protein [Gemmatimonadota bacterium]
MAEVRWPYWGRFTALAAVSLSLLLFFVFGFLPQRFLLELDFSESGFAYPVIRSPLPTPPIPPPAPVQRPVARGPAERFWAEYLPLVQAGADEAALGLLRAYLARQPEDMGAQLEYGRALWRLGRLDAAIGEYRRALARAGDSELKRELARLYVTAGRWAEALATYKALASAAPDDLELLREYAQTATWGARYELAVQLYARLVELDPDDASLRLEWARVLYWSDQPELAAEVLDGLPAGHAGPGFDSLRAAIVAALPPPDTATLSLLERARGLALAGDVASALAIYRLLMSEGLAADSLLLEMADVFEYRANAPDSALSYLRAYLARHPDGNEVRLRMAQRLAWSGRLAEAEADAEAILRVQPENAEAWALLGELRRWRGDRAGAVEAYQRSLDLTPDEATAAEGLAALRAQVDAELSAQGSIGPASGFEYFADSDEFSLARWRAGWTAGVPRTRGGVEVALERLEGFELTGEQDGLTAAAARAVGERWWLEGGLHTTATLGAWVPESGAQAQPIIGLVLAAPSWGGASYRFEYRREPAYRETATLEAAAAELRVDVAGLETYRPIAERWDLSARARVARFSGVGDANLRGDAALGVFFRPDARWILGFESRGLTFGDPAPRPGRRLYWDPNWSWENTLLVAWRGAPAPGWELEARTTPGLAWLDEHELDPTVVFVFGATLDARYRVGVWTLQGRAGFSQSRAGGYRVFRLELGLSRGFGG